MNLSLYKLTPLEQWLEELYQQKQITSPSHLEMTIFAAKFNIWLYQLDASSKGIDRNGFLSMNVDRRLSSQEQWEEFLHELCHLLRHAGNQPGMPECFLTRQEQDAEHFVLYASMPIFMIRGMKLPKQSEEITEYLADMFNVTPQTALRRLEQIERRIYQGRSDQAFHAEITSVKIAYDYSPETKRILDQLHKQIAKKKGLTRLG